MAEFPDALIDTYCSDQWRVHGGPASRRDREELRDRLIPLVIKIFGSVESSLDVLLKESQCADGNGIRELIRAYELYCLRMSREAIEAHDEQGERAFACFESEFRELSKLEQQKLKGGNGEREGIRALLRTSYCRLPARSMIDWPVQRGTNGNARPLGENPFPPGHAVFEAFEEATWEAKRALHEIQLELLPENSEVPVDPIQLILTIRLRMFSVCANAALLVVGNEKTADWYERWIDNFATSMLQETLHKGQLKDPMAEAGTPPLFTAELLPKIETDLHLQFMRVVAHYKRECADRALQARQMRQMRSPAESRESSEKHPASDSEVHEQGREPVPEGPCPSPAEASDTPEPLAQLEAVDLDPDGFLGSELLPTIQLADFASQILHGIDAGLSNVAGLEIALEGVDWDSIAESLNILAKEMTDIEAAVHRTVPLTPMDRNELMDFVFRFSTDPKGLNLSEERLWEMMPREWLGHFHRWESARLRHIPAEEKRTRTNAGRPKKDLTAEIHAAWEEQGDGTVSAGVCDKIGKQFFTKELEGCSPGSVAHRRVRERVRAAILRYKKSLQGSPSPAT